MVHAGTKDSKIPLPQKTKQVKKSFPKFQMGLRFVLTDRHQVYKQKISEKKPQIQKTVPLAPRRPETATESIPADTPFAKIGSLKDVVWKAQVV